jgi:phosphoribosyl 1,2-cyclic phosphate phosphodiesterase
MKEADSNLKVAILGSGTSTGVPVIACECKVCTSPDKRNNRTRSSILISRGDTNILIDTSTDLRYQALKNKIKGLSAVLFTHSHADHLHGIDELRSFNFIQKKAMACYADDRTIGRIKAMFSYIFEPQDNGGGGIPRLDMNEVSAPFYVDGLEIMPVEVFHGKQLILGYRIGNVAYITDCSNIPSFSMSKLYNLDLLILGALRHRPHNTHFNIEQALEVVKRIRPQQTYFTHLSHEIDYHKASSELPDGVGLAYDGLVVETILPSKGE